ncbi:MAG: efflux RND transporter periplasmic adaptor subunit, partial [Acidobacteriota bacterium]|nr:efflux RND transporter periplasmic adaptor subunit [Acidobacteriota bacterium]
MRHSRPLLTVSSILTLALSACLLMSCGQEQDAKASSSAPATSSAASVGVVKAEPANLKRQLTVSSELVPFQEIDVYAKESGFVNKLDVDYGSRVKKDQVLATLEIPELEAQLHQDDAAVKNAQDMITHAEHELTRIEAQHKVLHDYSERLTSVAKSKPGLIAEQEVDDAQGKDLAAEAQVEAAKANLQSAQSELVQFQAKKQHDQVLFDYSKITAPFEGVVTQRYANYGTLMQAGSGSSTQAMPLVRLSEDDLFRLVIPVPESYVRYIKVGAPVEVSVPSLSRTFPGTVARFSVDVKEDTRTMHTEVNVPNPGRVLIPGMYAEATLTLEQRNNTLAVPLQAVDHVGNATRVMVVNQAGKVEERNVELGIQTSSQAEVLSGLAKDEMVIVSDRGGLKAGQSARAQQV